MIIDEGLEQLRKAKSRKDRFVLAKDSAFNRSVLEQKLADILVSPDMTPENDSIKVLASGMNGIMARIAAKNGIAIGIDISRLRSLGKEELGRSLARISHNILLCRKANAKLAFTGQKDTLGARALLILLGASTEQASKAISF